MFVDERLPEFITAFRVGGRLVGAVLFDLEHFETVNDSSHEAGDEEFLLVLASDDAGCAGRVAERLRATVAGHDWSAVTPGRGITVSAGAATLARTGNRTSLLAAADARLHAAKAAGRNRVVG